MEDVNTVVDDIYAQLKNAQSIAPAATAVVKSKPATKIPTEDTLSEYIIEKVDSVIDNAMNTMETLQENILTTATSARDVEAYANTVKALTSALETLAKLHTARERNKTVLKSRESKESADRKPTILLTRSEILDRLLETAMDEEEMKNAIDVTSDVTES